jgi:hypothetical protein
MPHQLTHQAEAVGPEPAEADLAGFDQAFDADEWVWASDEEVRQQQAWFDSPGQEPEQRKAEPDRQASAEPPSMEELGLDPRSERDCEAYAGHLEAKAEDEVAIPLEMELSSVVTLMNPTAPQEQREFAAAYLRVVAYDRKQVSTTPIAWSRPRPRRGRAPRRASRSQRRVRARSGSRGDPSRSTDDDPRPARRAPGPPEAQPEPVARRRRWWAALGSHVSPGARPRWSPTLGSPGERDSRPASTASSPTAAVSLIPRRV